MNSDSKLKMVNETKTMFNSKLLIKMLSLSCVLLSFPARAVWLGAGILTSDAEAPTDEETFVVENFLKHQSSADGKNKEYTIDFGEEKAAAIKNQKFVDVLSNSITLTPNIKRQIGTAISELSDVCNLDTLSMKMYLAPMPDLASQEVNVKDSRRIAALKIFDCARPMPSECSYHSYDNNDTGLELKGLIDKLNECHQALVAMKGSNSDAFSRFQAANGPGKVLKRSFYAPGFGASGSASAR